MKTSFLSTFKISIQLMIPSLIVFYAPAKFAILTVVLLALIDTRWGLKLAKHKKIEITSNRASDFFAKLVGYFVFITFGLFLNAEFDMPYIVWISAIIPIYSEIFSIDEKQRKLGKIGILKQAENVYKFAKNIKNKRDSLR